MRASTVDHEFEEATFTDVPSDGMLEVKGRVHRVAHTDRDCEGTILAGFVTMRAAKGAPPGFAYPQYRPCEFCRPGQYAVYRAGLWREGWTKDKEAERIHDEAVADGENARTRARAANAVDFA